MTQSANVDTTESLRHVEGSFNYIGATTEKPATYLYKPTPDTPYRTWQAERHLMAVYDGRAVADRLSLDEQGFALVRHKSAVPDFYDDAKVKTIYYPEIERLMKEATGATRVLVFDHNVRCLPMAKQGLNGAREPVRFAHNDYTPKSAPQRVRDLTGTDAETLLKSRFAFINVWRPIRGPVEESPLAVCDARSLDPRDFVATDLKYRDRTGEVFSVAYNPNHRWFYFPNMLADEALLLKCFDSADDGRARWTAHCAFDAPNSPPSPAPRESIEARMIVFFAPAV
jgi:hypothetical protein